MRQSGAEILAEQRGKTGASGSALASVKESLLQATTIDEVRQIITGKSSICCYYSIGDDESSTGSPGVAANTGRALLDGLAEKLRATLQIPQDDGIDLDAPLIDQGVDSLSAVTIGTW